MSGLLSLLTLAGVGLTVGVLIGCVGVGGVLLVPSLTYIGGMEVHVAIASCMFSYVFSGAVGAVEFARRGSIRWSMAGWLCVGAMPGAFAGAATVSIVSARPLELLIATLIVFSGVYTLVQRPDPDANARLLNAPSLAAIGAFTGFLSAMSGTGGPLVLVPVLMWLKVPVLMAVGLSQVIQLPIAALATVGNFSYGRVDMWVGGGLAVLLMVGVMVGARAAHCVSAQVLRCIVASLLIVVGVMVWARLVI